MKNKNLIAAGLAVLAVLAVVVLSGIAGRVARDHSAASMKSAPDIYACPMHPGFTSDKPGDCAICGMKLVKKQGSLEVPAMGALAPEKSLGEVCVAHDCAMKDCVMHVRTNLKPGERLACPICGEVISTASGKVVEIAQRPSSPKERRLLYYRNPMDPAVTSPVPMKDPMGMDYVPVYEEAGGGVMISPERQQLIGVRTEKIVKRPLHKVVRAFGKIAYDPVLYVAQEEYLQAQKEVAATRNSVLASITQQSTALLEAAKRKLLLLGMSPEEIEGLARDGAAQENLYLPGGENKVWGYIQVYEYEIGLLKIGQAVSVEAGARPGEVFSGKIISINPVLDPETRTNRARVEIDNPEGKLKPEMFVNAKIQVDLGDRLAVPETAVLDTGLRKIVYLSKEGDVLESREVTLGQRAEGYDEVLDGLSEGDVVVTSGNFLVDSESKLKAGL